MIPGDVCEEQYVPKEIRERILEAVWHHGGKNQGSIETDGVPIHQRRREGLQYIGYREEESSIVQEDVASKSFF